MVGKRCRKASRSTWADRLAETSGGGKWTVSVACSTRVRRSKLCGVMSSESQPTGSVAEQPSSPTRQRSAGPRRKLTEDQEQEIARLYGGTSTPVSQISS